MMEHIHGGGSVEASDSREHARVCMIANGWQQQTFDNLIKAGLMMISDGYRAKNEELGGDGYIFLRAGHVTDTHIDFKGVERFHKELSNRVSSKLSQPGDVVVTTKGNSTGRVTYVTPDVPTFVYSPHLSFWRSLGPDTVVPGFLRYWSRGKEFHGQLEGLKASTDMAPYLSLVDQRRLRITLPTPSEQWAIARILGTLDDKIELNSRMNETLEAMARALFKSWFVDFDPVRAKAEKRQPAGMDADTAAFFPSSFEESALGLIPKGWGVRTVGDEVQIIKGRSYKSEELNTSTTALVTLKSFLRGGGYRQDGLKSFTGSYKPEQAVREGELVVAFTDVTQSADVIGKPAIVRADVRFDKLVASLDVGIVRPQNSDLTVPFFYCLFLTEDFQSHVYSYTSGTTVLHLSKDGIPSYSFARPRREISEAYTKTVQPMIDKIGYNIEQSRTLTALRNTLLPKLLSGEIRVREAERELEQVV
jgi:type I restriction enzyme S subunit